MCDAEEVFYWIWIGLCVIFLIYLIRIAILAVVDAWNESRFPRKEPEYELEEDGFTEEDIDRLITKLQEKMEGKTNV